MGEIAVDVQGVSKRFRLSQERYNSLKERLLHAGRVPYEDLWALRDVSFEVKEGETIGILGRNGSGKSTLLKCICGILQPTDGQVVVRGRLAGLLELGAGFQQELSGRDNIYLNGSMLGLAKRDVDKVFDEIVAFAELDQFIDHQVKFYSSGMYVRLGFAVAVNVDPDILVIDEVLAVGDERFQRKCLERIKTFQEEGRTILFVTHSPDQVRSICDRAVVLSDGHMIGFGPPGEAVRTFREQLLRASDVLASELLGQREIAPAVVDDRPAPPDVVSPRRDRQRRVLLDEVRAQYPGVHERPYLMSGDALGIQIGVDVLSDREELVFGIEVFGDEDALFFRTDTDILGQRVTMTRGHGMFQFVFDSFPLLDGVYRINVSVLNRLGGELFDWREDACRVEIVNPGRETGALRLPVRGEIIISPGEGSGVDTVGVA